MPKTAVHMIVLDEAIKLLKSTGRSPDVEIAEILERNRWAAVLGCIGPDLFFWAPDFEVVGRLYNFYKNWKWVIDLYNETIGKIKEAIEALGEPVEEAVETLAPATVSMIRSLIEEIRETANLLKTTMATGLFKGVIEGYDAIADLADSPKLIHTLFDMFIPPLQKGEGEEKWYWFDMLHYRWTGEFARNLVKLAEGDEVKLSFAYGYLTHIATDLVGHGYVNEIVGGPYRMHCQRHATCENFIDSWKFYQKYHESINSGLYEKLEFPDKLPESLAELLHDAFIQTYTNRPHPKRINRGYNGFLRVEDIHATYEVFKFVLEVLGGTYIEKPEEPFSGALEVLADALKSLEPPPSPPPGRELCGLEDIFGFGLTESSRECYEGFVEYIGEWLEYLGELILWTFETLMKLLDFLTSLLLSLPIMAVMAILYAIQLTLYSLYRGFRETLVLSGLVYPEPDELETAHGRSLITPYQCGKITSFENYPRIHSCELNNLQCPNTEIEEPGTAPAFYPRSHMVLPDRFISEEGLNVNILKAYASARSPSETRALQLKGLSIGNASSLSYGLIVSAHLKREEDLVYTDWNLDSDRGYGYKCWSLKETALLTRPGTSRSDYYL
ncbi:MAG: hypothetical protein DRN61_05700 [Thaumarchaeota archaeon]|nr:MAG: hypothetical protein DRN61_05700 [Nitrososphaerota archaeon]